MIDLGVYFAESAVGLGLFYILYRFLLQRDTLFALHRFYLIGAVIFSLTIPLFNFAIGLNNEFGAGVLIEDAAFGRRIIQSSNEVALNSGSNEIDVFPTPNFLYYAALIYLTGLILSLGRISLSLSRMAGLIRHSEKRTSGSFRLVLLDDHKPPFSFFNYVFLNKSDLGQEKFEKIISHERIHAEQLHSVDIIFLELTTAFLWFNPLIYVYKKSIKEVHEYLADRGALSSGQDRLSYLDVLLKQTMQQQNVMLASSYKQSLTKKRLKMMMKTKSGRIAGLKVCAVLPVVAFLSLNFALAINMQSTDADDDAALYADEEFPEYEEELVLAPPISGGNISVIASSESMKKEERNGKVEYRMSVDIQAPAGSPVLAAGNGMVFKVGTDEAGKKYIVLDHQGGYMTSYSGLGRLIDVVKTTGTRVTQGEVIGYLGLAEASGKLVFRYELILPHETFDSEKFIPKILE